MDTYPGAIEAWDAEGEIYLHRVRCLPNEARVIAGWILEHRPEWDHSSYTWNGERSHEYGQAGSRYLVGGAWTGHPSLRGRWVDGRLWLDNKTYAGEEAERLARWMLEHCPQKKWWWQR